MSDSTPELQAGAKYIMTVTEQDWHRMTSRIRKPDGSIALVDLVHELKLTHNMDSYHAINLAVAREIGRHLTEGAPDTAGLRKHILTRINPRLVFELLHFQAERPPQERQDDVIRALRFIAKTFNDFADGLAA
jgi:hypothetical protein